MIYITKGPPIILVITFIGILISIKGKLMITEQQRQMRLPIKKTKGYNFI
jgi:hypothetical protein